MTPWRLLHLDNAGREPMRVELFDDETAARQAFSDAAEEANRKGGHIKLLNPGGKCVNTFSRMPP